MNTRTGNIIFVRTPIAVAVASALLASCAAGPQKPVGAAEVRSRLTQLQSNQELAGRAPLAIEEADAAVRIAEKPEADKQLASHRVFMADRKVETARAQAQTRLAEDQRTGLSQQRESARLESRTREANAAQAAVASSEQRATSSEQRAASSEQRAATLQRQLDEIHAMPTDRGLVLTLGDTLFTSGQADLRAGATGNLDRLAAFLNEYPDRTALIEGHTDSVGSEDYNRGLSQRRADSVRAYLVGRGIGSTRLVASGRGESAPVAGNDSAAGRQENRRVEIVISNPPAVLR